MAATPDQEGKGAAQGARETKMARGTRPISLPPPLGQLDRGPRIWKQAAAMLLVLSCLGVLAFVFMGGLSWLLKEAPPSDWAWWHYVVAAPILGLLWIALQGVGEALFSLVFYPLRWRGRDHPWWKRAISWGLIALIAFTALYGPYYFLFVKLA